MRQRSSVQSLEAHPRLRMFCGLSQPSPVVWALRRMHAHECLDLLEAPPRHEHLGLHCCFILDLAGIPLDIVGCN